MKRIHKCFSNTWQKRIILKEKRSEEIWNVLSQKPKDWHRRNRSSLILLFSPVQLVLLISSAGRFFRHVTVPSVMSRTVKTVFSKFFSSGSDLVEAKQIRTCASLSNIKPGKILLFKQTKEVMGEFLTCCSGTEDVCWPASWRARAAPPTGSLWRWTLVCRTKLSPCKCRPIITDILPQLFSYFIVTWRGRKVFSNFEMKW